MGGDSRGLDAEEHLRRRNEKKSERRAAELERRQGKSGNSGKEKGEGGVFAMKSFYETRSQRLVCVAGILILIFVLILLEHEYIEYVADDRSFRSKGASVMGSR